MGLPRKRASKVVPTAQKKQKINNSSVTPSPTTPSQGLIKEECLYTVPCKAELGRGEEGRVKAEPQHPSYPNIINGDTSGLANISIVSDMEIQCNNVEKCLRIKEEQEEVNIGQNANQGHDLGPFVKAEPQEPLQENKKAKSYTCFCGKSYTCTSHLNRHRKIHASEDQPPSAANNISRIKEEKPVERSFICRCGKQYTRNSNLKRHQINCTQQAQSKITVSAVIYQKVEMQEEKIKPYVCACGKSYTSSSHLYRHQRTHVESKAETEKRFICECGKSYSCSSHLYRHQRTHTEDKVHLRGRGVKEVPEDVEQKMKPHVCFCGKRYTCSSHLYRHQKIHKLERPPPPPPVVEDIETEKRYKCQCGKSYSSSSHLYRHQRTHAEQNYTMESNDIDHDNEDFDYEDCRQKPYMCECGKSFILSFSLLLHKKIHCQWKSTADCDPPAQ